MRRHAKAPTAIIVETAVAPGPADRVDLSGSGAPRAGRALLVAAVISLSALVFSVASAEAKPPEILPGTPGFEYGASYSRAKAVVGPLGLATSWEFQFISDSDYEDNVTNSRPPFEGATAGGSGTIGGAIALATVRGHFTGLAPSTTYHVRLVISNVDGSSEGVLPTFTTRDGTELPAATTGGSDHVTFEHAYLRGSVDPNTDRTAFWFEFGLEDCAASACTSVPLHHEGTAGEGSEPVDVASPIGGLQPETTYHYRLVAENTSGTVAGLDQTLTTGPEPEAQECPNEAAREEVHARALPDCRAWELVSPPEKFGANVVPLSGRLRVAAEEAPGLPMAATFSSLGGFADPTNFGGASSEYLAERTLEPGTSGWTTHSITPSQESLTVASNFAQEEPRYEAVSPDLTRGIFRAYTPVPTPEDPHENVSEVPSLYIRDDLRTPGAGTYHLLSESVNKLSTAQYGSVFDKPGPPIASANFDQVAFQSTFPLTADAGSGKQNYKAYKSSLGGVRLVTSGSFACPGGPDPAFPCSAPGAGTNPNSPTQSPTLQRELSTDGSRLEFSAPVQNSLTKLYQLDDQGTADASDDAVIQLNASEKSSPEIASPPRYLTSSTDGSRVFFTSTEQLTDDAESYGLYLWARQDHDETQQVSVDATGGTFTLTARSQPSVGFGNLTTGSNVIEEVKGSFSVGQTIEGPGIQPGTTVEAVDSTLTLSQPAEATANEVELNGAMEATTSPLPFNATAAQVESALGGLTLSAPHTLPIPILGKGNVDVSGGPGASNPYEVTFIGALEGVNVLEMTADGSSLTGASTSASVSTTDPVKNLTFLGQSSEMLGASTDGHHAYFATSHNGREGIYYWQDADGTPGGTFSFVAPQNRYEGVERRTLEEQILGGNHSTILARVSPDGKHLLFASSNVATVGFDCGGITCREAYLYNAEGSTPTGPDLVCLSCKFAGPGDPEAPGDFETTIFAGKLTGASGPSREQNSGRAISEDNRYVFFSTRGALVFGDTNGAVDAYEYDTATDTVHLLSSGTDKSDSWFMDASKDGSDAFIVTRQRLSSWDVDGAYDLYDVRIDGGVPQPLKNVAECEGESCKRAVPPPPGSAPSGSAVFNGPGNPKRPCPRGKRAVRRGGKVHCVSKHARHQRKHQRRTASDNRRAGR